MTDDRDQPVYPDESLDPDLLVTNDAVGGETVLPGQPEGPDGGEPREASPVYDENDLDDDRVDLNDDELEES